MYSDNFIGTSKEDEENLIERQLLISDFDDSTKSTDCSNKNSSLFELGVGAKREQTQREVCNSIPTDIMNRFMYPCCKVVNYEKTLIKDSIVWKLAEREDMQCK